MISLQVSQKFEVQKKDLETGCEERQIPSTDSHIGYLFHNNSTAYGISKGIVMAIFCAKMYSNRLGSIPHSQTIHTCECLSVTFSPLVKSAHQSTL